MFKRKKRFLKRLFCDQFLRSSIKPFIDCANFDHNVEYKLWDNFEGEDDNLRFKGADIKLSNSLQGKIK